MRCRPGESSPHGSGEVKSSWAVARLSNSDIVGLAMGSNCIWFPIVFLIVSTSLDHVNSFLGSWDGVGLLRRHLVESPVVRACVLHGRMGRHHSSCNSSAVWRRLGHPGLDVCLTVGIASTITALCHINMLVLATVLVRCAVFAKTASSVTRNGEVSDGVVRRVHLLGHGRVGRGSFHFITTAKDLGLARALDIVGNSAGLLGQHHTLIDLGNGGLGSVFAIPRARHNSRDPRIVAGHVRCGAVALDTCGGSTACRNGLVLRRDRHRWMTRAWQHNRCKCR